MPEWADYSLAQGPATFPLAAHSKIGVCSSIRMSKRITLRFGWKALRGPQVSERAFTLTLSQRGVVRVSRQLQRLSFTAKNRYRFEVRVAATRQTRFENFHIHGFQPRHHRYTRQLFSEINLR